MTKLLTPERDIELTGANFFYELAPLFGSTVYVVLDFAGIQFHAQLVDVDRSRARLLFAETDGNPRVLLPIALGLVRRMHAVTWITRAEEGER